MPSCSKMTSASLFGLLLLSMIFTPNTKFAEGSALNFNQETKAYENFLVEITNDVVDAEGVACNELLKSLQVFIYEGSMALSKATDGGARLDTVHIMVPTALADACADADLRGRREKTRTFFKNDWAMATWETAHSGRADMRVSSQGQDSLLMSPHTTQHRGCGEGGLQMHFPAEFISEMETSMTCDGGRMFLAEFAKYRYGVFDEHGFLGDSANPMAYVHSTGAIKPTSCSNVDFPGQFVDGQGCLFNMTSRDCVWVFAGDTFDIVSSVMSHQYIDRVTKFCDDDTHNVEAPNKHNLLCEERSVMDVIRNHPDFATPEGSSIRRKKNRPTARAPPTIEINVEPPEFKITVVPQQQRKPLFLIANKWISPSPGAEPDMSVIKQPPIAWRARCRSLFAPLYFLSTMSSGSSASQASDAFLASFLYSKGGLLDIQPSSTTVEELFQDFGNSSVVSPKLLCNYRHPSAQPAEKGESVNFHEAFSKLQQNGAGVLENGLSLVLVHAVDYDYTSEIPGVMLDWVDKYKIPIFQVVDGPSLTGGDITPDVMSEKLSQLEKMKELSKYGAFVTFQGLEDDLGLTQARFSEAMTTGILPLLMPDKTPVLVYSSLNLQTPLECKSQGMETYFDFRFPLSETETANLEVQAFGIPDEMIMAAKENTANISIQLISPSGTSLGATNEKFMGSGAFLVKVPVGNKDVGRWTLKVTCQGTVNGVSNWIPPKIYFSVYMVPLPKVNREPVSDIPTEQLIKRIKRSDSPRFLLASAEKLSITPLMATHWQGRLFLPETKLDSTRPPLLQVKIETEPQSGIPVVGLDIVAKITRPDTGQVVEIDLHDNGLGMYDTTANDGIYSNFLVDVDKPGYYHVHYQIRPGPTSYSAASPPQSSSKTGISAFQLLGSSHYRPIHRFHLSNDLFGPNDVEKTIPHENFDIEELCCGHHYPHHATARMAPEHSSWVRHVSGPTFVVKSELESRFAPSRITDLSYDFHENWGSNGDTGIWLRWTMPEEVFLLASNETFGNLDYFDLRWSTNRDTLKTSFQSANPVNCNGDLSFNDLFYCHCLTYGLADSFYVAVRVKGVLEGSSVSNLIRVSVPGEVAVPTTTLPPEMVNDNSRLKEVESELERAYIILGCSCAFLFLVALILVGLLVYSRRRKRANSSWMRDRLFYKQNQSRMFDYHTSVSRKDPEVENRDATDDNKRLDIHLVQRRSRASTDQSGQIPNHLGSTSVNGRLSNAAVADMDGQKRQKPVRVAPPVAPPRSGRTIAAINAESEPRRAAIESHRSNRIISHLAGDPHPAASQERRKPNGIAHQGSTVATSSSLPSNSDTDDFTSSDSEVGEGDAVPTITVHAPADGVGVYNQAFQVESLERRKAGGGRQPEAARPRQKPAEKPTRRTAGQPGVVQTVFAVV